LDIFSHGSLAIVGNYGSGKTEVAINLAAARRQAGVAVRLADLDLVNPYFRTREARRQLTRLGIEVLLPPEEFLNADLPVLSPVVAGAMRHDRGLTLLDVGGDGVGARVLAALADAWKDRPPTLLQVINPFRPETDSVAGCQRVQARIEAAARLPVAGWIANAHCMDQTGLEDIRQGIALVDALAEASQRPLVLVTVPESLLAAMPAHLFNCPSLPIRRQLVPPWLSAQAL
jgi:hypothetical protein